MASLAPTEIKALARIIDELDYYQLLHLPRTAGEREVKAAFHSTSRVFHPDGHRHAPQDLREAVDQIAKRITEAYSVLRDGRRRNAYDRRLESGGSVRIQLSEARAEATRMNVEQRQGRTAQGRQYFALAEADMRNGNPESAARNLRTALTFEPDNPHFKARLSEIHRTPR